MPVLIVQRGHCYRTTGATGTTGEQAYATAVADACIRLLHGKAGWQVRSTLADENYYRGDAFVAIHCDGSTSSTARGASIGYRTPEGQQFGQAWKQAYFARGWVGGFRPDNYTAALSGYYGTGNAVAAGNRRAFIAECGFRTNAEDRALLDGPGGPERVALAIGDALSIPTTAPERGFLMALSDEKQDTLYNRVMGFLDQRYYADVLDDAGRPTGAIVLVPADHPNARPCRALDTADGHHLVQLVEAVTKRVDAIETGAVDVGALAAALRPGLVQELANELDGRARDNDPTTGPTS